ncbi:hypothetical protein ACET7H_14185 [Aeromonas veronii]|uniref:hypothetical protein n=1 Tax=Aeromonas veronii TaxID=654 RepID=UPI0038E93639
MQFTWISLEDLFSYRLANRTGATKNKKTGLANDIRQLLLIFADVISEQIFISTNKTQNTIFHHQNTKLESILREKSAHIKTMQPKKPEEKT